MTGVTAVGFGEVLVGVARAGDWDGVGWRGPARVHHCDCGVQHRAIRCGRTPAQCEAVASVGSKGTPFGFALAGALNSLYKAELIRNRPRLDEHGPREGIDAARTPDTAQWVHWYNTVRPHCAIGMRTPGRARGRPGPRHRPPGTTTTGHHRNQEGYSGVVLKAWGVRVVVVVCSGGSSSFEGLLRRRVSASSGCDAGGR